MIAELLYWIALDCKDVPDKVSVEHNYHNLFFFLKIHIFFCFTSLVVFGTETNLGFLPSRSSYLYWPFLTCVLQH